MFTRLFTVQDSFVATVAELVIDDADTAWPERPEICTERLFTEIADHSYFNVWGVQVHTRMWMSEDNFEPSLSSLF